MTGKDVFGTIAAIRAKAPLIHNITNLVVTNTTANALLAIGASPAMVEGADEVESFVRAAAALVINLGTMNPDRAAAMRLAASAAQAGRIPWIMDPVAVGALAYRTQIARDLMDRGPTVIRGNASEILALSVGSEGGKGVDLPTQPRPPSNPPAPSRDEPAPPSPPPAQPTTSPTEHALLPLPTDIR